MGFLDDLTDAFVNPWEHPLEAAMIMAVNEELEKEKYAWREWAEDGSEYGLDPEDYETEEEYLEALEFEMDFADPEPAYGKQGIREEPERSA